MHIFSIFKNRLSAALIMVFCFYRDFDAQDFPPLSNRENHSFDLGTAPLLCQVV